MPQLWNVIARVRYVYVLSNEISNFVETSAKYRSASARDSSKIRVRVSHPPGTVPSPAIKSENEKLEKKKNRKNYRKITLAEYRT